MKKEKPIIFNTNMVLAILNGKKNVTRRVIKGFIPNDAIFGYTAFTPKGYISCRGIFADGYGEKFFKLPYQLGDILYVRETFQYIDFAGEDNGFLYKASENGKLWETESDNWTWRPSIHMPKDAARIYLKVTNVRVERLQDITTEQARAEGYDGRCECPSSGADGSLSCVTRDFSIEKFGTVWDSTIKKSDLDRYGWDANPYVFVIEFMEIDGN